MKPCAEIVQHDGLRVSCTGSDNISAITTLALYFLLTRPPYYRRLQQELDSAYPDPNGPLDAHELAALPFLNGVINEALRLGTPFFLPRIVPQGGAIVDQTFIPENTIVALAAHTQQLSADNFFPDPRVHQTFLVPRQRGTAHQISVLYVGVSSRQMARGRAGSEYEGRQVRTSLLHLRYAQ